MITTSAIAISSQIIQLTLLAIERMARQINRSNYHCLSFQTLPNYSHSIKKKLSELTNF